MPIAYFATKISENIAKTPEGFLLCRNVPIARIGYQEYINGIDINVDGVAANKVVKVYRSPEQVFSAGTIASAEGKDVTDLHPSQMVNINNHASYSKGHGQNVRKGDGDDEGFLVSDLFIKDACLINKIENGQREVSCGYNYDLVEGVNGFEQVNIVINHIAIVPEGRAGKQVAIRDAKPTIEKEIRFMDARQKKNNLVGRILAAFAKDAAPEDVAEASQVLNGEESARVAEPAKPVADEDPLQQILSAIQGINGRLDKLEKGEASEVTPEQSIDEACCELEKGEKGTDEAGLIEPEKLSGEELPSNPIPGADAAIAMLKAAKPAIAAIADPVAKKQAADALLASAKTLIGGSGSNKSGSYAEIAKAARAKAADAAKSKETATDDADLGKNIKQKFHRKPVGR